VSWENNHIQFCRMLGELASVGLSRAQYTFLKESMDLSKDDIDEILDRAQYEFDMNVKLGRAPKKETCMRDLRAYTGNERYQS